MITTEHRPETEWGKKITDEQSVFVVAEKLYEPVRMSEDMGVTVLLEPQGPLTDSVQGMRDIVSALNNRPGVGICLDTGNSWLAGAGPDEMAREFKDVIGHIHWKDLPAEMEPERGKKFDCGFSTITLGEGGVSTSRVSAMF